MSTVYLQMAMILAGEAANLVKRAAEAHEITFHPSKDAEHVRVRNLYLYRDYGPDLGVRELPLFDQANDGHPFALDREGLIAQYEHLTRVIGKPSPAHRREFDLTFCNYVLERARQAHERAIDSGVLSHIHFTWRQLCRVQAFHTAYAGEGLSARLSTLVAKQKAGKKSRDIRRLDGHDWKAICSYYDSEISAGTKRATIMQRLGEKHNIRRDVLARGLRQRERGRSTKK